MDNKTPQTSDTSLPPPGLWTTKHHRCQTLLSHRQTCEQQNTADVRYLFHTARRVVKKTPQMCLDQASTAMSSHQGQSLVDATIMNIFSQLVSAQRCPFGCLQMEEKEEKSISTICIYACTRKVSFNTCGRPSSLSPPFPFRRWYTTLAVLPVRLSCRVTLITSCQSCWMT